jgi:hypothetical protein
MAARINLVPIEQITRAIRVLRGRRVILDAELAALYGVTTERLNQQVRRNHGRFPADFLFQLNAAEFSAMILQNSRSKPGRGGRRKLPLAFTEPILGILRAIRELMNPPLPKRRGIGFTADLERKS